MILTQLISNAPWTVTFNSPSRLTTLPSSVSPSLRRPTPLSSQRPSVNPSTTLGTVSSELVLGLDTSWPPPTTSVSSSDTLTTSAKDLDTSMSASASSINSLHSPNEMDNDELNSHLSHRV